MEKSIRNKLFSCIKCNRYFASKFSMQRHSEYCGVVHKRINCSKCNKSLKNVEVLLKHRQVCFGLTKKAACGFCDEVFCSQFSLRRHFSRFHSDEKLCNKLEYPEDVEKEKMQNQRKNLRKKIPETETTDNILNFKFAKIVSESESKFKVKTEDDICFDYEYLENETKEEYIFS